MLVAKLFVTYFNPHEMSRIGKLPINIPAGVDIKVSNDNEITVKGKLGELSRTINSIITINIDGAILTVNRPNDTKEAKALHGLYRSLIFNMVKGVSEGYQVVQELVGVGYRAAAVGQNLELTLGFSHNVLVEMPKEILFETKTERGQNPKITLKSADKELLGLVAAKIRSLRKPEPYKGKGIKFEGEILRRKAGKSAGK